MAATATPSNPAAAGQQHQSMRFQDLTIDDTLPLLERVLKYAQSEIALQRLVHVRQMADVLRGVPLSQRMFTMDRLSVLFPKLVDDPEILVRQGFVAQLVEIALICLNINATDGAPVENAVEKTKGGGENDINDESVTTSLRNYVLTVLVPYMGSMLSNPNLEVRRSASEAVTKLASELSANEVRQYLLDYPLALLSRSQTSGLNNISSPKMPVSNSSVEDMRAFGVVFLGELCQSLSGNHVREVIVPHLIRCKSDKSHKVRSACAIALPRAFNNLGDDSNDGITENDQAAATKARTQLLDAFCCLSEDSSIPCRNVCSDSIEIFNPYTQYSDEETLRVREKMVEITLVLLHDEQQAICVRTLQRLGPIIASICFSLDQVKTDSVVLKVKESVALNILPFFCGMTDNVVSEYTTREDQQAINDMRSYCAYNFPGVLLSLGREYWTSCLRQCFINLLYDNPTPSDDTDPRSWEELKAMPHRNFQITQLVAIRRIISHSLHDLASILGQKLMETDLYDVLEYFLFEEDVDGVRAGVIKHASALLDLLSQSKRAELIKLFPELYDSLSPTIKGKEDGISGSSYSKSGNWRMRVVFTEQLCCMFSKNVLVASDEEVFVISEVIPLAFTLLGDPVAGVRESAAQKLIPSMLCAVYLDEEDSSSFNTTVQASKDESKTVSKSLSSVAFENCIARLQNFAVGDYEKKQLFCNIMCSLIQDHSHKGKAVSKVMDQMIPFLMQIEKDPVANVRLTMYRSLRTIIDSTEFTSQKIPSVATEDQRQMILASIQRFEEVEDDNWWQ
uniref:Uncharacterized protein n=1 Tax=Leptocylindrus danicus TaxID=163516 RepID=A0A7S2LFG4_9STRA